MTKYPTDCLLTMQFQPLFSLVKLHIKTAVSSSITVKEIRDAIAKVKTTKGFGRRGATSRVTS